MSRADRVEGYGWVGAWADGTLGWEMPRHLEPGTPTTKRPHHPEVQHSNISDEDFLTLCRITIEPVRDKRGRPIRRCMGFFRRYSTLKKFGCP